MTWESAAGVMIVQPAALVETDSICRGSTDSIISGRAGACGAVAARALIFVAGARGVRRSFRSSADNDHFGMRKSLGERIRKERPARGSWVAPFRERFECDPP